MPKIALLSIIFFGVLFLGCSGDSPNSSNGSSLPVPVVDEPGVVTVKGSKFRCRDLELAFQQMSGLDYTSQLTHVSNTMSLESTGNLVLFTAGDAERALTECEVPSGGSSSSSSSPPPPAVDEPGVVTVKSSKFRCRDLELAFQQMSGLDYTSQLTHVSNTMSLESTGSLVLFTAGDAERALTKCGVMR